MACGKDAGEREGREGIIPIPVRVVALWWLALGGEKLQGRMGRRCRLC